MRTWKELVQLVQQFDDTVWDMIPPNGSRYSASIEIGGEYDDSGEGWVVDFHDEFFPFTVKGKSMEEVILQAYDMLHIYYKQVKNKDITAHYVVGNRIKKEVKPFSIEDCRKWRQWQINFLVYPTKHAAEAAISAGK